MSGWILFYATLSTSIGQSVIIPLMPPLGRQAGLTEFQVSLLLSTSSLVFAIGATCWGRAIPALGHKRVLLIGLMGYTLGTLIFGAVLYAGLEGTIAGASLFIALLLSRSLQSSIMSATPPTALSYSMTYSSGTDRMAGVSRITSASSLGQVIGPATGGLLVGYGLLTPLFSMSILTFSALLCVYFWLPPAPQPIKHHRALAATEKPASAPIASPIPYVLIAVLLFCALSMMQQSMGFFFMDTFQLNAIQAVQQTATASLIVAFVSVSCQLGLVRRFRAKQSFLLTTGLLLLTAGYGILSQCSSPLLVYAIMPLIGAGMGLSYPTTTLAASNSPEQRQQARSAGLITAAPAIGYVIGPPIAALLYGHNHVAPYLCASLLILAATALHLMSSKR